MAVAVNRTTEPATQWLLLWPGARVPTLYLWGLKTPCSDTYFRTRPTGGKPHYWEIKQVPHLYYSVSLEVHAHLHMQQEVTNPSSHTEDLQQKHHRHAGQVRDPKPYELMFKYNLALIFTAWTCRFLPSWPYRKNFILVCMWHNEGTEVSEVGLQFHT